MNVMLPAGFAAFRSAYDAGRGSLVWRRGVADLETPVAAYLKLAHGRPNSFLLESVEGGATRGRYSVIGMAPDLIWRCQDGKAAINRSRPLGAACLRAGGSAAAGQSARADQRNAAGRADRACRRWRAGWSVILATTWSGRWRSCRRRMSDHIGVPEGSDDPAVAVRDLRQRQRRTDLGGAGLSHRPRFPPKPRGQRRKAGWTTRGRARSAAAPPAAAGDAAGPAGTGVELHQGGFLAAVARCKDYVAAGRRVPDRHQPALLGAVRAAAVRAVSLVAADQPGAVPVLSRFRRVFRGRLLARRSWCGCATAR